MFIEILFKGAQAFFILHSEVQFFLPYLLRWCYVILDNFHSCFMFRKLSWMRYVNPSFSFRSGDPLQSINHFVGVILCHISPKAFPKECCQLWCLSMIQVISLSSWWKKFFISLVFSIKLIDSVSDRISPQF